MYLTIMEIQKISWYIVISQYFFSIIIVIQKISMLYEHFKFKIGIKLGQGNDLCLNVLAHVS